MSWSDSSMSWHNSSESWPDGFKARRTFCVDYSLSELSGELSELSGRQLSVLSGQLQEPVGQLFSKYTSSELTS